MKHEERLTKKICGYYHGKRFVGGKGVINDGKYYRGCFDATAIVDRLGELEDKIEAGMLVEVPWCAVVHAPEERSEEMRLANEERKRAVKEFAEKLRDKEFSDEDLDPANIIPYNKLFTTEKNASAFAKDITEAQKKSWEVFRHTFSPALPSWEDVWKEEEEKQ